MATAKKGTSKRPPKKEPPAYLELNDVERVLIYEFLERIREDVPFRQAILRDPEVVFAVITSRVPLSKLLRPNLLEAMGKLRRVALEELGIDVAPFRDDLLDNGFKLSTDNKR